MQVNNVRFKNLEEDEKNYFYSYFEGKKSRIEEWTRGFDQGVARFFVEVEKFPTKSAYKVKFEFEAPKIYLIVSEDDHTINEAVDLAVDKLIRRLRKEIKAHEKIRDKELRRRENI